MRLPCPSGGVQNSLAIPRVNQAAQAATVMTHELQKIREVPVPWAKLKQVTDAYVEPRLELAEAMRVMCGVFLVGLAIVAFAAALVTSLDPDEILEPATHWVIAGVGLGFTRALIGWLLLICGSPSASGDPHSH